MTFIGLRSRDLNKMAGYRRLSQNPMGNDPDQVEGANSSVNVQVFDAVARDAQEVRKSSVSFLAYMRAGTLSSEGYKFVDDYQSPARDKNPEEFDFASRAEQGCTFLREALSKIKKEEPLRFAMTVLSDLLYDERSREAVCRDPSISDIVRNLVSLLNFNNNYIMLQAGLGLARVTFQGSPHPTLSAEDSTVYLRWIVQQLTALDVDYLVCLTEGLKLLLRLRPFREAFFDAYGLKPLTDILTRKPNFQLQYQVCFCLWMLSFNNGIVERLKDSTVVMVTADTLRATTREKVRRVVLALYRNLLHKASSDLAQHFAIQMVTHKVTPVLNVMVKNSQQDEDLADDLEFLHGYLSNSVNEMSSFDEFSTLLKSKRLEWSPVHKSDKFWRENVHRLHDNNYDLLKRLLGILEESKDAQSLAVACYDLGEYVRHLPRGKRVLEELGGKELIISFIESEDGEVRANALLALQKIMVQNWEYLGKTSSDRN